MKSNIWLWQWWMEMTEPCCICRVICGHFVRSGIAYSLDLFELWGFTGAIEIGLNWTNFRITLFVCICIVTSHITTSINVLIRFGMLECWILQNARHSKHIRSWANLWLVKSYFSNSAVHRWSDKISQPKYQILKKICHINDGKHFV